ncbi:hypothetical protein [Mycolicibacterium sp. CBMA 295]|uniref:hypothetical protein n=1 Tax=Mycolicibacterium sp. CBMA 295 TaxID=2606605 RepID=UPI001EE4CD46|nr:hypothetical protein [Mycolicibacterium sp. CBMA 295]
MAFADAGHDESSGDVDAVMFGLLRPIDGIVADSDNGAVVDQESVGITLIHPEPEDSRVQQRRHRT